jgi:tripeptide aminopeptidase
MINACTLAMEFDSMLPQLERPEYTEGHEGFIHLCEMSGDVETMTMEYIIRDFEKDGLEEKKQKFREAAEELDRRYGEGRATLTGLAEYSNPRDEIMKAGAVMRICQEAFRQCGIEEKITPIRGGTDGSTLAEKGLACVKSVPGRGTIIIAAGNMFRSTP